MARVWPLKMPPTPKSVLVSLADNANDHGVCWPSINTICARTCFGRTAVMEAIGWLEQQGYLHPERRDGRNTRYHIILPTPDMFHGEQAVRQPDWSARRTSPPAGQPQSASRTAPVREADPNHKEPSLTVNSLSHAVACAKAMIDAGMPAGRVNASHPDLLRAAAVCSPEELADLVREITARGGAPPNLAYVCTTALNRRSQAAARDPAHGTATDQSRRPGHASGESPAQRASRKIRARYQAQDEAAAAATVSVD